MIRPERGNPLALWAASRWSIWAWISGIDSGRAGEGSGTMLSMLRIDEVFVVRRGVGGVLIRAGLAGVRSKAL